MPFSLEKGHLHTEPLFLAASFPVTVPCPRPSLRQPLTALEPLPAFCSSTNWKFGWPCLFIFMECSRLYFHGTFSAVQRFNFKITAAWEKAYTDGPILTHTPSLSYTQKETAYLWLGLANLFSSVEVVFRG